MIVTEEVDAAKEIYHVKCCLGACSYPSWSFKKVKKQMDQRENNWKINKQDSKNKSIKTRVTQPYIRHVSEALSQVFCNHGLATLMKPHLTLKRMLV